MVVHTAEPRLYVMTPLEGTGGTEEDEVVESVMVERVVSVEVELVADSEVVTVVDAARMCSQRSRGRR